LIAIAGAASALFVIMANAWMNAPVGFDYDEATRTFSNIDPIAAMFNPAWKAQVVHMLVAAYMATGFAVAGVHAFRWLRGHDNAFNRNAIAIAMALAAPMAIVQPIVGHWTAQVVGANQPVKLAAMEGQFETERGAPLRIGGWPDEERGETRYAIELPGMLSFLAYNDFNAEVRGLNDVPREDWPPVAITHVSFQLMVAFGMFMFAVAVWWMWVAWVRRRAELPRALLWCMVIAAPLGFLAIEFGWIVTEVGRQPWVIQGIMRTKDAVTPMPGLVVPFVTFTVVYIGLAFGVTYLMIRQVRATREIEREVGGG
jgi:cytochrome d ubiquinol oxidase subunit I